MEHNADFTTALEQDTRIRKRSGWLVAVTVFLAAYAISVANFQYWGLALGWLPSTFLAAAFGWIAYGFPWLIDVVAILLELLAALG
jgi:hypothetical protein